MTNRQLSWRVHSGQPGAVDLERLTRYSCHVDSDSTFRLVLRISEARLAGAGVGSNGMQHISPAPGWVFDHDRGAHLADPADTSTGEIGDDWSALQQELAETPELATAERHAGLVDVLPNKRWW